MTGTEENLSVAEAVFVLISEPIADDVGAGGFDIPVNNLASLAQQPISLVEVVIRPTRRKTGSGYSDSLEDSASAQLLNDFSSLPPERFLLLIRLDAANIMRRRRVKRCDELGQALPELRSDRLLMLLRGERLITIDWKTISELIGSDKLIELIKVK